MCIRTGASDPFVRGVCFCQGHIGGLVKPAVKLTFEKLESWLLKSKKTRYEGLFCLFGVLRNYKFITKTNNKKAKVKS
jgi:hypothetical protein